jgi:hypothetical protein
MMPIFSSTQPSLRARVLAKFPAQVLAGTGIVITKNGGTYTFAADLSGVLPLSALAPIPTDRLLGRDTAGTGAVETLTVSGGLSFTAAGGIQMSDNQRLATARITLFNNGSVLTTGIKADYRFPFSCTIQKVTLLADQSGSIVLDIWKDSFANYPPTVADTITDSAKPTLSSATKYEDGTLTNWIKTITAGDTLRFNIDSVATVTRVEVLLDVSVT